MSQVYCMVADMQKTISLEPRTFKLHGSLELLTKTEVLIDHAGSDQHELSNDKYLIDCMY